MEMQIPVQRCWKVLLLFGRVVKRGWEIKGESRGGEIILKGFFGRKKGRGHRGGEAVMQESRWRASWHEEQVQRDDFVGLE
jgi:hypothetical protein